MKKDLILNECPRDAMQGLTHFVPTELKIRYHNALLKAGFSRLDFGSFVSPKAIPQLADTAEVLDKLELDSKTKLLAIIANRRGAESALTFGQIDFLGFPLSVSEQFQQRNTNKSIEEALAEVAEIQNLCTAKNRRLVVYLSMAFGNPYGDAYSPELILEYGEKLLAMGIAHLSLADTIGKATKEEVSSLFKAVSGPWSAVEVTAHLHASPMHAREKIQAAWEAGCCNFDSALGGYGGCPMAEDKLVGNLSTETLLEWAVSSGLNTGIDEARLREAQQMLPAIFSPAS
jgi:hydroxymethylglutaryl-CoA lyase